ncbi:hypothetical protein V565_021850 [Rhizoctonia solani 123E]|uniref:Uncharacterized protein n=2 Tax=Rhizoctonia solani AG-3 TaxID=1086053 RepID=A0A074SW40_9AGAM|nr:hypothetical protein V565_021850 [Rhizoctonia solani 123E]
MKSFIIMFTEEATKVEMDGYKRKIRESGGSIKYEYDSIKGVAVIMPDDYVQTFANDPIVDVIGICHASDLTSQPLDSRKFRMADKVPLSEPHPPTSRGIEAFNEVLPKIKQAVVSSRRDWNKHEPRMWARASGLDDNELTGFVIEDDLIEVRAGSTSYGMIVFGKIRIPGIKDEEGEGFIHVRYVSVA